MNCSPPLLKLYQELGTLESRILQGELTSRRETNL